MPTPIPFDPLVAVEFLLTARSLAARGYVHNALGNIVIRAPHPDHPGGVAYTKHASVSLEELTAANSLPSLPLNVARTNEACVMAGSLRPGIRGRQIHVLPVSEEPIRVIG